MWGQQGGLGRKGLRGLARRLRVQRSPGQLREAKGEGAAGKLASKEATQLCCAGGLHGLLVLGVEAVVGGL